MNTTAAKTVATGGYVFAYAMNGGEVAHIVTRHGYGEISSTAICGTSPRARWGARTGWNEHHEGTVYAHPVAAAEALAPVKVCKRCIAAAAKFPAPEAVAPEAPAEDTPAADSVFSRYAAALGEVVTEGHTKYCRAHGHATWTVAGQDNGCPRCGLTTKAEDAPAAAAAPEAPVNENDPATWAEGHGYSWERPCSACTEGEMHYTRVSDGTCISCVYYAASAASADTHDIRAAWKFIVDSYDSGYSPNRRDWTDVEIFHFVAEHHVTGLQAFKLTPEDSPAMARAVELAGMSAPGATRVNTGRTIPTPEDAGTVYATVKSYFQGGPGRGECVDAVIIEAVGGHNHAQRLDAAVDALERLQGRVSGNITTGQHQTLADGPGARVLFIFGTWEN